MANNNQQMTKRMLANFVSNIFVPLDYPFDDADFLELKLRKMERNDINAKELQQLLTGEAVDIKNYMVVTVKGPTEAMAAKRSPVPASIIQPSEQAKTEVAQEQQAPSTQITDFTDVETEQVQQPSQPAPAKETARGKITALHPVDVENDESQEMDKAPSDKPKVKAIRRNTKNAEVMALLADGNGYTIKELQDKLGWATKGGVASVVYKFPKANGYGLEHDKNTGKYKLVFPEGVNEILYRD